jgi:hypothetical protein
VNADPDPALKMNADSGHTGTGKLKNNKISKTNQVLNFNEK